MHGACSAKLVSDVSSQAGVYQASPECVDTIALGALRWPWVHARCIQPALDVSGSSGSLCRITVPVSGALNRPCLLSIQLVLGVLRAVLGRSFKGGLHGVHAAGLGMYDTIALVSCVLGFPRGCLWLAMCVYQAGPVVVCVCVCQTSSEGASPLAYLCSRFRWI